jgi:multidrug efflux pump subunit AcrB
MSLVVTTTEAASLQSINRLDRDRAIGITGNVAAGHSQQEAMTYVDTLAKDLASAKTITRARARPCRRRGRCACVRS